MSHNGKLVVEPPCHEEGKLHRLLEGTIQAFPGNVTLSQYFKYGLDEGNIDPESLAIEDGETLYTFKELDDLSSKFAEVIRDTLQSCRNLNPDQDVVIGVCIPPSDKLILSLFAILKLGAAYLPFDVSFPDERVVKMVKDSKPIMIISDYHTNVIAKFDSVKDLTKVISTTELHNLAMTSEFPEEALNETEPLSSGTLTLHERTAIVLYTSGSSGEPKGVRLSHRIIMNRLNWQWQEFPFNEDEKCVFKTSLTFVDSVAEIFCPLLQGQQIIILGKMITSNPNIFIQKMQIYQVTRLVLVPSLLKAMFQTMKIIGVDEGRKMLQSIKLWVCSGETLSKDLLMEFFGHFPRDRTICNFYGSTEVMADVAFVSFSSRQDVYNKTVEKHVPIGLPITNTVIYILTADMDLCEFNETGEIYIAGYNLARGYVGTKEHPSFVPNPFSKTSGFNRLYRTGDFGKIIDTPDGSKLLAYEGRVDSQIKVRGQRVDLAEIELVLAEVELVSKVKVLCYHPGQDDQAIIAFVVPVGENNVERIKALANNRLRDYERPMFKVMEDIPLLVNGKTDRQRLLQIYEQEIANRPDFVDWVNLEVPDEKIETAKAVIATIAQVTGTSMEVVAENLENSFYNIGGSSLNSVVVIVKLREMKYHISIQDFISAKAIKHIIWHTHLVEDPEEEEEFFVTEEADKKYVVNMLTDADKEDTTHIIAHSFSNFGDLEVYTKATYDEFILLINSIWRNLVDKGFSFMVRRVSDNKAVATGLNFDVYDEPTLVEASQGIEYVLEMLEFLESRQREKLPKGKGKLIHSFMMGTSDIVDQAENVFLIEFMEEQIVKLAKEKNFQGIMTTNTNPLTQQVGLQLHGYEVLSEYQVNKYVAPDGTKPFLLAPDGFKIVCCWKKIKGKHNTDLF